MLEAQFSYVLAVLQRGRADQLAASVKKHIFDAFNDKLQREVDGSAWAGNCNSWYKTADGRVINDWSGTVRDYQAATRTFKPAEFDFI